MASGRGVDDDTLGAANDTLGTANAVATEAPTGADSVDSWFNGLLKFDNGDASTNSVNFASGSMSNTFCKTQ